MLTKFNVNASSETGSGVKVSPVSAGAQTNLQPQRHQPQTTERVSPKFSPNILHYCESVSVSELTSFSTR